MLSGTLRVDKERRYTPNETCEVLGICRKTLWKYTKAGEIVPIMHRPSGRLFYLGSEIDRFYRCTI